MSRAQRLGLAFLLAVVALAATGLAWVDDPPAVSQAQAVQVTRDAFRAAGIDATIEPEATAGTYQSPGHDPVVVWKALASVRGATVQLYLRQSNADPVYIDDRTPNGTRQVLSKPQFEALVAHAGNPALTSRVHRNLSVTLAAACILAVVVALASITDVKRPR